MGIEPRLSATFHLSSRLMGVCASSAAKAGRLGLGLLLAGLIAPQAARADGAGFDPGQPATLPQSIAALASAPHQHLPPHRPRHANFHKAPASENAIRLADWVVDSGDNHGMPFVIVDKTDARVFVFQHDGSLRGAAAALLGLALGDESIPGIGDRALSGIRPEERTTPAGRFVASLDRNSRGKGILWVDYDSAVSLHPVLTSNPRERRQERLDTPTSLDNRISYGCINVPAKFYSNVVNPVFTGTNGIVYVLPEVRTTREIFPAYYEVL